MIPRILKLPKSQSFFLFGPRQTGKSTLVSEMFAQAVWRLDLLQSQAFLAYSKDPSLFRRQAEDKIGRENIRSIFIDEIQRVPDLLNEIQSLMQSHKNIQFIITGSSARKLKRGAANLLGGRAVERHLFPFCYQELQRKFDLDAVLRFGTLPAVEAKPESEKMDLLNAYVTTYLREEIQNEGLVRNLGGFARFLDLAASQAGEVVSFSNLARESALPIKTVQSYYEILEDTLVGFRLEPWRKSLRKRLAGHPKFFLFDLGVVNALNHRLTAQPDPVAYGRLFEQFIIMDTYRQNAYLGREVNLYYWRTNHGAEVDLLLERHGELLAAVECKSSTQIGGSQLSGLRAFHEEHPAVPAYLVCRAPHAFKIEHIQVLPWREYFSELPGWLK